MKRLQLLLRRPHLRQNRHPRHSPLLKQLLSRKPHLQWKRLLSRKPHLRKSPRLRLRMLSQHLRVLRTTVVVSRRWALAPLSSRCRLGTTPRIRMLGVVVRQPQLRRILRRQRPLRLLQVAVVVGLTTVGLRAVHHLGVESEAAADTLAVVVVKGVVSPVDQRLHHRHRRV